ncbi:GNAT family N-acetyltransferase [Sporosalibacterium faouarense]|uniref:GNAT family N-acetyltransferase n=1 Tax=Sporosalibacterium faouarense TaxID=516123 RepID=UPI00192CBFDB|nr:GNAT family N-acetyltransferase [Sporosalibacterium faouarense]
MIKEVQRNDKILGLLKENIILNQNIIAIINNVPKAKIYVDNTDNPTGVFVKNGYFHYIYTRNNDFIDDVCNNFFKEGFFGLSAVEKSIADKIISKYEVDWINPCRLYYLPEDKLDRGLRKNKVERLRLNDAKIIDGFYEYSNPGTLDDIKNNIERRPSSAIYIGDELVSWVLVHNDNSMGIMYTKEEHRGKGYAIDVTIDLASKIIDNGDIPFVHIVEGNYKSEGLAAKCGFQKHDQVIWGGIVAGTPKQ